MWYNENIKHNERAKNGIWSEALANGRFYRFPIASTQPRLRGETYPHRGLKLLTLALTVSGIWLRGETYPHRGLKRVRRALAQSGTLRFAEKPIPIGD